jgi:hypothetical protein
MSEKFLYHRLNKHNYYVKWSEEDQSYVGLCVEFPSLSWLDKTKDLALKGIENIVEKELKDDNIS